MEFCSYYSRLLWRLKNLTISLVIAEWPSRSITNCKRFQIGFFVQLYSSCEDINWHCVNWASYSTGRKISEHHILPDIPSTQTINLTLTLTLILTTLTLNLTLLTPLSALTLTEQGRGKVRGARGHYCPGELCGIWAWCQHMFLRVILTSFLMK